MINYKNLSIIDIEGEIWKDIEGWEGFYQISSKGRVKSIGRNKTIGDKGKKFMPSFIMKQNIVKEYLTVIFWKSYHNHEKWQVHRLVGFYFVPNPYNKPTVNHDNTIKLDNDFINLIWATHQEQQLHAVANGLRNNTLGENSNFSKLTKEVVLEIRNLFDNGIMKTGDLSVKFNTALSNVRCIVNRKTWKHI